MHAVWPPGRFVPAKTRVFIDAIARTFAHGLRERRRAPALGSGLPRLRYGLD